MKHVKEFETKKYDQVEILDELINVNPLHETHDFYIFIGRDDFEEAENGMYKKILEIENMVKITPDVQSINAMNGLEMRVRFQQDSNLYHIWLPKEIEEDVSGKGSQSIESWLVDLIDKHKMKGDDEYGKQIYREIASRKGDSKKYNL